ncbi:hypothetical protein SAMN05428945_5832 [Streptomyces sp. 2224.1]|uniref:hypothetical protein n=1 Tax=Streptomyces sp. 2224.1 TaxID=1881020 RepID=UPI000896973B|nr:hypothetical protein [Streptomyces sp. 2224.1]SED86721.1 hypothetical protein SAMN05428945_5832 [Streptomyces sp. 2224.1]
MPPIAYLPSDDPLFGTVDVGLDHEAGVLVVAGDGLPRADVRRVAGTPLESHVPIGTRDPGRLTMRVDSAAVSLRPAKGFLTRRSYQVDVGSGTKGYGHRLVPVSLGSSRLLRDGAPLGVFTSTGDGIVTAEWETGTAPSPYDASIGYALATAFGTGAEPMWKLTLDAVLAVWF